MRKLHETLPSFLSALAAVACAALFAVTLYWPYLLITVGFAVYAALSL